MRKYRKNRKRNAYILFTREPQAGYTKTRLMPYFTAEECEELHKCFLRDIKHEMKNLDADIVVVYQSDKKDDKPANLQKIFGTGRGIKIKIFRQRGDDIWEKMDNAIADTLALGYDKVVLTGADIPELKSDTIASAFDKLNNADVVLGPTKDDGYYLVGMKKRHSEVFKVQDVLAKSENTVFGAAVDAARNAGLSIDYCDVQDDIDTPDDIAEFRSRMRVDRDLRKSSTGRFLKEHTSISIIVPVYNEENTVNSIMGQLVPLRDKAEIIFVDGGSTDNTVEIIGKQFRIIESQKSRGVQLNRGAEEASGDILFFLHCDSRLPENALAQIREVMASHEWGYFGVKFKSKNVFMFTNNINSGLRASLRNIVFGDQGMFIDRSLFTEIGGFPEIPIMEDYDFSLRMRRRKIKPGKTKHRIRTSTRRYGESTISILKTELMMFSLRRKYRRGEDPERIAKIYRDIR